MRRDKIFIKVRFSDGKENMSIHFLSEKISVNKVFSCPDIIFLPMAEAYSFKRLLQYNLARYWLFL